VRRKLRVSRDLVMGAFPHENVYNVQRLEEKRETAETARLYLGGKGGSCQGGELDVAGRGGTKCGEGD